MKITPPPAIWLLLAALLALSPLASAEDLILTSPPREKPEEGAKQYGPLADHLSKLLGRKVVYQHPGNWLNYQRDMRDDKYDIVFDGPHFISWRMLHLGHEVLVRLPGVLEFYLVANKSDEGIKSVEDMIAEKFCTIPPPNLAALTILAAFPNPVRQPVIKGVGGGMAGAYKGFTEGQCRAAALRTTFYKKQLKDAQREQLKIVYASKPVPDQGISVSKRLNARDKSLIVQSLTLGDGVKLTLPTIQRFAAKDVKAMIPARQEDYVGLNTLLEGVIFGWE